MHDQQPQYAHLGTNRPLISWHISSPACPCPRAALDRACRRGRRGSAVRRVTHENDSEVASDMTDLPWHTSQQQGLDNHELRNHEGPMR